MEKRRLLVLAVLLALFSSAWFSYQLLSHASNDKETDEALNLIEPVTKSEPISPYPNATSVNLLIHDLQPDHGSGGRSSNPLGTILTKVQRAEFDQSVRKITLLNDGSVAAVACFDPHHFFRYYDATGQKIGEISVCFCCGNSRFDPVLRKRADKQWIDVDIDMAERFVKKLGLPTDMHCPEIR
jgi:hypothetical protein